MAVEEKTKKIEKGKHEDFKNPKVKTMEIRNLEEQKKGKRRY